MAEKRKSGCFFTCGVVTVIGFLAFIGILLSYSLIKSNFSLSSKSGDLVLKLDGTLAETSSPIQLEPQLTVRQIVYALDRAAGDKAVASLIVRFTSPALGIGTVSDVRDAIVRFKASGKPVIAYLDTPNLWGYYAASAADQIVLAPSAWFFTNGLRLEPTYFKGTMDKLGIQVQVHHIGDYKTAYEQFTRDSMSPEERESLESLLNDLYQWITEETAKSRKVTGDAMRQLIDNSPMKAQAALDAHLVDKIGYFDEIDGIVQEKTGRAPNYLEWSQYAGDKSLLSLGAHFGKKIGLVYAEGSIYSGESGGSLFGGKNIGSKTMAEAIHDARNNSDVKAIVLRIDSPGGSGEASDEIWREVYRTRGVKPIIASMSNVAASGGYYIAMACDEVFAQPTTITGSIGVVSVKFVMKGFYDFLGMKKEVVKRGKNADMFSDNQPYTDDQVAKMHDMMDEFYWDFVKKAAQGRGMDEKDVHKVAQGRVWSGKAAKDIGLVTQLGGLWEAVAFAKDKAGIKANEAFNFDIYPKAKGLLGALNLESASSKLGGEALQTVQFLETAQKLQEEPALALMPYTVAAP